jgi:hypothetical protein
MKTLLLLLTLVTLASCGGKKSSDSDNYKSALNGDGSLHASIDTIIERYDGAYEYLSNQRAYESQIVDGVEYYCSFEIQSGAYLTYSIKNSKLTLNNGRETQVFERIKGSGDTLDGSWMASQKLKKGTAIATYTFDKNKLTIDLICKF